MKRIAAFEKVSFAQYEKDFADAFPGHETAEIRAIYDDITKPKRATAGSAGYDFSAPVAFVLKPGETIKIPTGIRARMDEDWVLCLFPRSGQGFNKYSAQNYTAAESGVVKTRTGIGHFACCRFVL